MSVENLHDPSQLRGLSYDTAKLYGMPHIGSRYLSENVRDYLLPSYFPCAACGKPAANVHHEPPRGKSSCIDPETGKNVPGSFLLCTPMGKFVILPALICLCGTGTMGCHGDRHAGRLSVRWEWDSDESERKWWDGTFLKAGLEPNGEWLWSHGRYVFARDGKEWSYRG